MNLIPVHIRVAATPSDEEEAMLAEQMREMGILKPDAEHYEWRMGYITADHIETFYPAGKENIHTNIITISGGHYLIKESLPELVKILLSINANQTPSTDGKRSYDYTATVS